MQIKPPIWLVFVFSKTRAVDGMYNDALPPECDADNAFSGDWLATGCALKRLARAKPNDSATRVDLFASFWDQVGIN
jgi:hypothetical protein